MSPHRGEDAQMAYGAQGAESGAASADQVAERWRYLRRMLIEQLDKFETGGLVLRANNVDISHAAIADLKRNILEFDALISGGA